MNPVEISIISQEEMDNNQETKERRRKNDSVATKDKCKVISISIVKIVGFSILFVIPWTIIPRTNSILYQSYWLEASLPVATTTILNIGSISLDLKTWTKERDLFPLFTYLIFYLMTLIPYMILYISSYVFWSIYLDYNHPMPNLGLMLLPTNIIALLSLWFILPSDLLEKRDFRKQLKVYMKYYLWIQITLVQKELLSYLFANFPLGYQFFVVFMVAGCRELDKRVRAKLVTKMMGVLDESAVALLGVLVSSDYSFFMAIRLVGAEVATICCNVTMDLFLHAKMTRQIIKQYKVVNPEQIASQNRPSCLNTTKIIIAELVEGCTPIIYGVCMLMAYYGPNAGIFSNVGNNYWSDVIEDISPLYQMMIFLFAVDTFGAAINSFCIWKLAKVDMFHELYRVLEKYWHFMAVNLALTVSLYFATTDVNFGLDGTNSFEWISNEGWINLVNISNEVSNVESKKLLDQKILP